MPNNNSVTELAKVLANSRIVLSGEIAPTMFDGVDVDLLASKLIEVHKKADQLSIVGPEDIKALIDAIRISKIPVPIEVIRSSGFKPIAAEYDSEYKIENRNGGKDEIRAEGNANDFVNYFRSRLRRMRGLIESRRGVGFTKDIESINAFTGGRDVAIIGIVAQKIVSKKGNIMVTLEDETGEAKVMFMNGTSAQKKELFDKAGMIVNDEVMAVRGKTATSGPWVFADEIMLPDVPIKIRKKTEEDIAIAFMSDIHVGSKRFLERNFLKMIEWLNGNVDTKKELAGKVKYVVMAGDVADGIGVYPGQDRDLAVLDIYAQYQALFNYIDAIPDYIQVFVLPGNHDAVQRAEPQPPLGEELIRDFKRPNVHVLSNPSYITLHGLDVLTYHGTSLDSMIAAVPGLSYAQPEKAMVELLRRRHLSPIYGGNVIVPSKEDNLVIDKVPDILHMGHIHKNGMTNYHGVDIVNSGTWQARTDFQIKQGHIPSPGILPVYEMKIGNFSNIDFGDEED